MRSCIGFAAALAVTVLVAAACVADSPESDDAAVSVSEPAAESPSVPEIAETPASGETPGPEPIRVGAVMAASGLNVQLDGPVLDALRYAVRQVNASGGVLERPVELLFMDSESELNVAFQATNRLVELGVPVIFATCDPYFSRPVMEVAHAARVLVITPCGPEPRVGGIFVRPLAFSAATSAVAYGRAMAEHLADEGVGSVALLVEGDDDQAVRMCQSFSSRFAELGGSAGFSFSFDRFWIAGQASVTSQGAERSLAPVLGYPMAVICAGVGGRGTDFIQILRSVGVRTPVLAPAALDGVAWRVGTAGVGPLRVVTEASTYGDDPSDQVNGYFVSLAAGHGDSAPDAVADDRVGWAVIGADALWAFVRAVQRTESLDPLVLASELERFRGVELWMGTATLGPEQHVVSGRPLRFIDHAGGVSRLVEVRLPSEPVAAPAPAQ